MEADPDNSELERHWLENIQLRAKVDEYEFQMIQEQEAAKHLNFKLAEVLAKAQYSLAYEEPDVGSPDLQTCLDSPRSDVLHAAEREGLQELTVEKASVRYQLTSVPSVVT